MMRVMAAALELACSGFEACHSQNTFVALHGKLHSFTEARGTGGRSAEARLTGDMLDELGDRLPAVACRLMGVPDASPSLLPSLSAALLLAAPTSSSTLAEQPCRHGPAVIVMQHHKCLIFSNKLFGSSPRAQRLCVPTVPVPLSEPEQPGPPTGLLWWTPAHLNVSPALWRSGWSAPAALPCRGWPAAPLRICKILANLCTGESSKISKFKVIWSHQRERRSGHWAGWE